jgi:RNA polymerase sigma-70 factor, ECF subfamily
VEAPSLVRRRREVEPLDRSPGKNSRQAVTKQSMPPAVTADPAVAEAATASSVLPAEVTNPGYARRLMNRVLEDRQASPSAQSAAWLSALRSEGPQRDRAIAKLHELLLRACRFELGRRRAALSHVRGEELDDIAVQAANDALMAVLAKLDDFRGASRFTTWAYKFALLEAGVKLRRRAWQGREVVLDPESWEGFAESGSSAHEELERSETLDALREAIEGTLTPHQREVFVAVALNEVPIDVLAERLGSTRGALYKTLHDARGKLRRELAAAGLARADEAE